MRVQVKMQSAEGDEYYVTETRDNHPSVFASPAKVEEWKRINTEFRQMQEELRDLSENPNPPTQDELAALEAARENGRKQRKILKERYGLYEGDLQ